jgi:hypothetical protein
MKVTRCTTSVTPSVREDGSTVPLSSVRRVQSMSQGLAGVQLKELQFHGLLLESRKVVDRKASSSDIEQLRKDFEEHTFHLKYATREDN